eukprot:9023126-Prorocentrum_lima.AAC.1
MCLLRTRAQSASDQTGKPPRTGLMGTGVGGEGETGGGRQRKGKGEHGTQGESCLLYTSPSPRDSTSS